MENTLTGKQAALFCSLMIFTSKILVLPSLFYETNKFAGIWCLVIVLALELLFLHFMIRVKIKHPDLSLKKLFGEKLGKILLFIVFFVLFLFFFLKFIYLIQECFSFFKKTLFEEAPISTYLICLLPVITACVYKGLKAFGRTLELFYLVIIIGFVFGSIIWLTQASTFSLTLSASNGLSGLVSGVFDYAFWFGDFFFFILFFDKIQLKKDEVKSLYFFPISSAIVLVVFYFSYFYIYQTTSFTHVNAIVDIIQFATNLGSVGKLDIVQIMVVMFLLFFNSGLHLFCMVECLKNLFPFTHRAQPLIVLNALIIPVFYLLRSNINNVVIFYSEVLKYFSILIVYLFPLALVLLYFIKHKKLNK